MINPSYLVIGLDYLIKKFRGKQMNALTPAKDKTARQDDLLKQAEQRLLWLSHWMIHHANHIRPSDDGIKTGGHQASSASMVSMLTALYFSANS